MPVSVGGGKRVMRAAWDMLPGWTVERSDACLLVSWLLLHKLWAPTVVLGLCSTICVLNAHARVPTANSDLGMLGYSMSACAV